MSVKFFNKSGLKRHLIRTGLYLSGGISALLCNFAFIDPWLIPDPCYFHSHKAGIFIKLLYNFPASEGGHPIPSVLNLGMTAVCGAAAGHVLFVLFLKAGKNKNAQQATD